MITKICSRCKIEKNIEEFNFKNKSAGLRGYHCNGCSRQYLRNHYNNNREYYLSKAKRRNTEIRRAVKKYIWDFLSKNPCVDCGESDPVVLEFDHISNKIATVSNMYRNYTLDKIKMEIKKCQVRCANCHRRKTATQLGWHKNLLPL